MVQDPFPDAGKGEEPDSSPLPPASEGPVRTMTARACTSPSRPSNWALSGFAQGGAPSHDRRSQAIPFQAEKILN